MEVIGGKIHNVSTQLICAEMHLKFIWSFMLGCLKSELVKSGGYLPHLVFLASNSFSDSVKQWKYNYERGLTNKRMLKDTRFY